MPEFDAPARANAPHARAAAFTPNERLARRDLAAIWHPCTQMKDHEWLPMIPIRSGSGVWLEDFAGHRYLDAISSWWVNLFGHANPTHQRRAQGAA